MSEQYDKDYKTYYFIINQEYPCLSRLELYSLLETLNTNYKEKGILTGVILLHLNNKHKAAEAQIRSSTIKEVGLAIAIAERDEDKIIDVVGRHDYCPRSKPYFRPLKLQRFGKDFQDRRIIERIYSIWKKKCGEKWKREEKTLIRILHTDGIMILGEVIEKKKKGFLLNQNPHDLPFYKPGALNTWYTRLLINIGKVKTRIVYDPFCGTGSIPLAGWREWMTETLCSDIRRDMCWGASRNFKELSDTSYSNVVRADATTPPIREGLEAVVVTDPPYGRSVRSIGGVEGEVLGLFLEKAGRILGRSRIVLSLSYEIAGRLALPPELEKKHSCLMYVHNRLSREIIVVEKDE